MFKIARVSALAATTVLAGTVLAGTVAQAATVNISSIGVQWTNLNPGSGIYTSGDGKTISWGGNGTYSSYTFSPTATPFAAANPFALGNFTHNNYSISTSFATLSNADLKLTITGNVDGQAFSITPTYTFTHDETSNTASNCPGQPVPCNDYVSFTNLFNPGASVDVNGTLYTIALSGFMQGGSLVNQFVTTENQSNVATLYASWTETPPPSEVPLPAGVVLLLSAVGGLGGVGALRARRKRDA